MIDEERQFLIDIMKWSFSRLNAFYNCKREWKDYYLDHVNSRDSFYGQYGSFIHKILEKYAKGELDFFQLVPYYEQHYAEEVNIYAPRNEYKDVASDYYQKGIEYLGNVDLDFEKYEILGVEHRVDFNIGENEDIEAVGYIDLLLRDKETEEITILDHKSASIKILKSGKISKTDQEHFLSFKRQLYLYSIAVIEKYGRCDYLEWNLFKERKHIRIPWDKTEFEEAKKWASDTVKAIREEKDFNANPDYFYCCNLCGTRYDNPCPYFRLGTIYSGIHSKCYSKRNKEYFLYGGAGIEMQEDWEKDPQTFYQWALDNGYDSDYVLKRYDETGNYDMFNCYWERKNDSEYFEY